MQAQIDNRITADRIKTTDRVTDISDSLYTQKDLSKAFNANVIPVSNKLLSVIGVAHLSIDMPISIAREWYRHEYDLVRSEVSRRYVDSAPQTYVPQYIRKRNPDAKQGSLAEPVDEHDTIMKAYLTTLAYATGNYLGLIEDGVAPEVARFVLPQAAYTSFIETGSIDSYLRIYGLRAAPDAQMEIRMYAHKLRELLEVTWPSLWEDMGEKTWKPDALTETNGGAELLFGDDTGSTVDES